MKTGRPRKAKSEKREKLFRILLTETELTALEVFAASKSLDTSTWARATLMEIIGYKK